MEWYAQDNAKTDVAFLLELNFRHFAVLFFKNMQAITTTMLSIEIPIKDSLMKTKVD